jgi:predicted Zn-dependent protease
MKANRQTRSTYTGMSHKPLVGVLVVVSAATSFLGAACGGSLSPAEAVAASGANFRAAESFEASYQVTIEGDDLGFASENEMGYDADKVAYSTVSIDGELAMIFIPPDLYMRPADDTWYVLSPWDQGIPRDELPEFGPDDQIIDYGWISDELSNIEQLPDESIDGEKYLRYAGTIDLDEASPEAASETVALRPFGITEGTLDIDLWLYRKSYLPRKVQVSVPSAADVSNALTGVSFEFLAYNQPLLPPQRPEGARPWRDLEMPEAACAGSGFAQCLELQDQLQPIAQDSCQGSGKRICLVPLGQVSPALVQHLVDYYRDEYGLTITVLDPAAVPSDLADPIREQIDAATLIVYMGGLFYDDYTDPQVVLIGITPVDLYDQESHFRYLFGLKGTPESPQAILSTFRMNPESYGASPDDALLFSRARKLVTKYIGILYYGMPPSDDPQSPLYNSILSVADLDAMQEPLPVPGNP